MVGRTTDLRGGRLQQVGVGDPVPRQGSASLPFGSHAQAVRYRKIDLGTARSRVQIPIAGANAIAVYGSSAPLAYAMASFSETDQERIPLREGLVLRGVPFRDLYLSHVAQPDQYLGILTVVDGGAAFDIQLPPPIGVEALTRSGLSFQRRYFATGVAGETSAAALLNDTDDWVGIVSLLSGNSAANLRVSRQGASNATIAAEPNMVEATPLSTFMNWDYGATSQRRTNQLKLYAGTHTFAAGLIYGLYQEDLQGLGRANLTTVEDIIMPGFHAMAEFQATNNNSIFLAHWSELPMELWSGAY